jgi:hypothetical protein
LLKAIFGHFDSDSSTDERRKVLHILYRGSWDITFRRVVKTLRQALAATTPEPRAAPHHKWMETSIGFDAPDCPKNMVGVGHLPLVVTLTIINVKLYVQQPSTSSVYQLSRSYKFLCLSSLLHARFQKWA